MPTGYTAKLCEQDVPFREFILTCARGMGACITLRDDDLAPAPRVLPLCHYHHDERVKAKREVSRLTAMTKKEREAYGAKLKASRLRSLRASLKSAMERNSRLTQMETEVQKWNPPTKDHEGLKKFMLEQISVSKDTTNYYHDELAQVNELSAMGHFKEALATAKGNIVYHGKEQHEEDIRQGKRNAWLSALHDSLNPKNSKVLLP